MDRARFQTASSGSGGCPDLDQISIMSGEPRWFTAPATNDTKMTP